MVYFDGLGVSSPLLGLWFGDNDFGCFFSFVEAVVWGQ